MLTLETDYLIIGSGAMGMAFADVLVEETEASMIIVDRHAKPGGHWNVAYPFVTLHQPSKFYGVSSKELSKERKDEVGLNKGLYDLATGSDVSAYYEEVMRHQFLPTGRVQYFPLCDYQGDSRFVSMMSGQEWEVKVNKKIIDCTYLKTSVPSTHTPNFTIDKEVQFMPLNDLPKLKSPAAGYVVIGGGKTGIDACLWLLENHVDPDRITWILSRDAWLLDRKNTQPSAEFFEYTIGAQAAQFEAVANSTSIPDLFNRLEDSCVLLRLDPEVTPQMFHGATISQLELEQLRRIKNIVRKGRVKHISRDKIHLEKGSIPTSTDQVHVDCSASAISPSLQMKPIFDGNTITPQTVRSYQPVFSAAFIAHVEVTIDDEKEKNRICNVVPLPNHDTDWIRMLAVMMVNQFTWSNYPDLRKWLYSNRLDGFSALVKDVSREDESKMAILKRMKNSSMPAMMKLQQYLKEIDNTKQMSELKHPQLQVEKKLFFKSRIVDTPETELQIEDGEILVKVDKFAFTANNITYAVAGDMVPYWKFFPPTDNESEKWGIIPVWGFAEVVESTLDEITEGERIFGYFPPASHLKMKPTRIKDHQFIEGIAHRAELPAAYNLYARASNEPGYSKKMDNGRSLLFPLFLTSFCLWDALVVKEWYDAQQIIVLSASSKTSIGLGYALQDDKNAPQVIGITSSKNLDKVKELGIYDTCFSYDNFSEINKDTPTVIVDMSGNAKVLAELHELLSDHMKWTINVGLTHWSDAKPQAGIIKDRSEFFFAPGHMMMRIKEWGPDGFNQKVNSFVMSTIRKSSEWLKFKELDGLEGMEAVHQDVCNGQIDPRIGLIIKM